MIDFTEAMIDAGAREQDAWIDAQIREHAPALADVPERVARFLSNVQRMMAASNPREAEQYAAEVAREAGTLAIMRVEWTRLRVFYAERAPLKIRLKAGVL